MPKISLTDAYLKKLKPDGKAFVVSDLNSTGLRLRVSKKGVKTFALQVRDPRGKVKTITLGRYPELSLKAARDEAARKRLEVRSGVDVNGEKRRLRQSVTGEETSPSLRELLREYEILFGSKKKIWAPAGPRTKRTQAGRVVERVFEELLDFPATAVKVEQFAKCVNTYKPVRRNSEKKTANGQASKARLYLSPVLDWAAGRKSYAKIGACREPKLEVASLETVHDPASDDPTITGMRERVLTAEELEHILPWLKYPAPQIGQLKVDGANDFRPIAMRFMLFTAARREEVVSMLWGDFDRRNGVWRKPRVKSTKGGPRGQDLPLSNAAIDILKSLPGYQKGKPSELVFPNSTGNEKLGNWPRFQKQLYKVTQTNGWNRHDLRRTSATLMKELKVPLSVIDRILAHSDPLRAENVGASASHYLHVTKIMRDTRDPQEQALSTLAEALHFIEGASELVSESN
ncbi:tyrosine-type recombinase/integrase [Celeribacter sp.]|uniref:tyrosine-type recombinase/integrase n=1 Tax=Celeribacter sp. TaxID=1890673 RepID=UPI003A937CD6